MSEFPDHPRHRQTRPMLSAAIMALVSGAVLLGAIFTGVYNDRATRDEREYHLQVIEQFSREFPHPNLSDYRSATGPGYHLILAAVHRWITTDLRTLRAAGAIFTVLLVACLAWATGMRVTWPNAVALSLPIVTSLYVFVSGVWLLPDNLAWLTVLAALLIAFHNRVNERTFIAAALVLAAAVFVRQTNIWLIGPLLVASISTLSVVTPGPDGSWIATPEETARMGYGEHYGMSPPSRYNALFMFVMAIPAILCLAWFHHLWHGLVPPAFQSTHGGPLPLGHSGWQHEGPNLAVPAMVFSVFGVCAAFFSGFLWHQIRRESSGHLLLASVAAVLGAASALIVPTEYTPPPGPRYSGLWNIAGHFPAYAHRSPLIVVLAALGAALLAIWYLALNPRDRRIWLAAWLCFVAAQTANAMAWHKYYEPFCLMMLALGASRVAARHPPPRWAALGPVALAVLLAFVTLRSFVPPQY